MALYDSAKKPGEGVQFGSLHTVPGTGLDSLLKGTAQRQAALSAKREAYALRPRIIDPAIPESMRLRPPSPSVSAPATSVRTVLGSTVGGGGSTPTGGVPASPAVKPDFSGARGRLVAPAPPAAPAATELVKSRDKNGNLVFTGTGGYAPLNPLIPQAGGIPQTTALARPGGFTSPRIADVASAGVNNPSESVAQRQAREAAISEIGTQLFLNRGKTTRSVLNANEGLLRTQADLTNNAGAQEAALKNAVTAANAELGAAAINTQGFNDRAVIGVQSANEQSLLQDVGKTERTKLALAKPETITDAGGRVLSLSNGLARPVITADGKGVQAPPTKAEGAITPVAALASIASELAAAQQSPMPDVDRVEQLRRHADELRRPNAMPLPGDVIKGYRFRGGDPSIEANWERLAGGAP